MISEWLCTKCNMIHPPQSSVGLVQYCPDCHQMMKPTSPDQRRIEELEMIIHSASIPEPDPIQNTNPAVWDLVLSDMKARDQMGVEKYGMHLQPFNGREPLWDAYQEALDLVVYLRQEIFERTGK